MSSFFDWFFVIALALGLLYELGDWFFKDADVQNQSEEIIKRPEPVK